MARIDSKFVKIKEAKEEETIIQLSHFGWNKTGELKRENGVVTLSFERRDAPKQMKKLEKDYKKLNKSVPVGGIVIAVLGLLTFIPFAVIDYPIAKYSILSVAVLLLVMGAFFIGAFFLTIIWGVFFSLLLAQFNYFICPAANLHTNILSKVTCDPNPVFIPTSYNLPVIVSDVFSIVGIKFTSVTILPIILHSVVLSIFASLIGPFGGFFASGLKRAFKIKDFGDTIPGHGGVTDRFDCQLLMAAFSYIYFITFIKTPETTVTFIMDKIINMDPEQRVILYNQFKEFMSNKV